jgi:hypothetical protein
MEWQLNVGLTFSVGDTIPWFPTLYRVRQVELVTRRILFSVPYSTADDILPPTSFWGEKSSVRGSCPRKSPNFSGPARKPPPAQPDLQKNHWPCILEGHFLTNPILSAPHLQDPKSNIYVHFRQVNKQLTGISFEVKPAIKHENNLEVKNITKPSLALRL